MNQTIGFQLAAYSLLLAGLSYLTYHLAPATARTTLITGLIGGVLCLAWSLRAIAGHRSKALPILTLIPVSFTLLSQTFMAWSGGSGGLPAGQTAAVLISVLLALSLGMLMRIAWAGVVFDVAGAEPTKERIGRLSSTSK
jgi:hypothetical protein